jgi:anaerobic magnesium-protoporphyrin IX monomethyl ester cyclase
MSDATPRLDLVLIHPGGRRQVYQGLADSLTAVEPPLWCRLIAGYCRSRGRSVAIIDSEAEGLSPEDAAERTAALGPRLVAPAVYGHQPSASTQSMPAAEAVVQALKAVAPALPVLIVGGHAAALPERTLAESAADFVCSGEGPATVEALLAALIAAETDGGEPDLSAVAGLVWSDGETIRRNPPAPLGDPAAGDFDDGAWDLLPMERYRAHNWQCFDDMQARRPYASIFTTLGCPYRCVFCCINAPFGKNGYRMRPVEAVLAEIDLLIERYGVRTFKIVDEMFVLNDRHVRGISEGLAARNAALGGRLNFWAYARVDTVKPDMLDLLRRAGFRWLALGVESGSKLVRDGAKKALRQEDIVGVVRSIQQAGINVIGNYIFGLPDDDMASMRATLDLAKELNCEFANFYSAMAYPGSPLYDQAVKEGWDLPDAWSGYSQHSHDCKPLATEKLTAAQVLAFRDQAFIEYFSDPRYLQTAAQRFGADAVRHIKAMNAHSLKRRLLEDEAAITGAGTGEPA